MSKRTYISESAAKILETLCQMAFATGNDYVKIENSGETFMPVSVEVRGELEAGKIISVSHFYLDAQSGDLISDPSMEFLRAENGMYPGLPMFTPLNILDHAGFREAVKIENNKFGGVYPNFLADLILFTSMWMKNIKNQQKIKVLKFNNPELIKTPSVVAK